ncbi:unnamed protein product [Vitrella brassicaformis CCMP3155]|uniref:Uncharacterized protein n=2 Tax=Vitrella brassicaformis TaxID=1169539 RepID=A0A0G4F8X9_VITBC|nr:unnamed protein product [Vitrella brassicaformis CCMP3155]|mmetsp:Transcript_2020/g.4488  ORF Transcript_2020/g.4488 Transcript_2020/m.4488 type:complete len:109 (+) Transcript_2020:37-363(+)|eukprot:CEM09154.1 unnamed protein product [Vitrella brassicaformis CCMP3155]
MEKVYDSFGNQGLQDFKKPPAEAPTRRAHSLSDMFHAIHLPPLPSFLTHLGHDVHSKKQAVFVKPLSEAEAKKQREEDTKMPNKIFSDVGNVPLQSFKKAASFGGERT